MEKKQQQPQIPQKEINKQLNIKSIQSHQRVVNQHDNNSENKKIRPRPPTEKDKIKKKRKLLSFEDQIEEDAKIRDVIKKAKSNEKHRNKDPKPISGLCTEEQLKKQFIEKTQRLKNQVFELDYSYWDGPSIIKKLKRKKCEKVQTLIEECRLVLIENFQKLAALKSSDLLFVIKDFIVPHTMRICDIEALQLKTATGQNLFNFHHVTIKELTLSVNMNSTVRIIEKSKYQRQINNYPFINWRTINVTQ